MTLRYVEVTAQDLHREFHTARQRAAEPHSVPVFASLPGAPSATPDTIGRAIAAARHALEMYRRGLADQKTRRRLQRLDRRLLDITTMLDRIATEAK
jgi:hypothetical protein